MYNDGAYLSLAFDAVLRDDIHALMLLDKQLGATKMPRQVRDGSAKLGIRLLKIFGRYETHPVLLAFLDAVAQKQAKGFFPIAFAIIAAAMSLDKNSTLYAFYYNAAIGAITNGVKLIPLSQMDGQDILYALRSPIEQAVQHSLAPDVAWIGAATLASDIRAMRHEQLYTRLYMS